MRGILFAPSENGPRTKRIYTPHTHTKKENYVDFRFVNLSLSTSIVLFLNSGLVSPACSAGSDMKRERPLAPRDYLQARLVVTPTFHYSTISRDLSLPSFPFIRPISSLFFPTLCPDYQRIFPQRAPISRSPKLRFSFISSYTGKTFGGPFSRRV